MYGNPVFSFAMGWLSQGKSTIASSHYKQEKTLADRDTIAEDRNSFGRGSSPNVARFNSTHWFFYKGKNLCIDFIDF